MAISGQNTILEFINDTAVKRTYTSASSITVPAGSIILIGAAVWVDASFADPATWVVTLGGVTLTPDSKVFNSTQQLGIGAYHYKASADLTGTLSIDSGTTASRVCYAAGVILTGFDDANTIEVAGSNASFNSNVSTLPLPNARAVVNDGAVLFSLIAWKGIVNVTSITGADTTSMVTTSGGNSSNDISCGIATKTVNPAATTTITFNSGAGGRVGGIFFEINPSATVDGGASVAAAQTGAGDGIVTYSGTGASVAATQTGAGSQAQADTGASVAAAQIGAALGIVTYGGVGASVAAAQIGAGDGAIIYSGTGASVAVAQIGAGSQTQIDSGASVAAAQIGAGVGVHMTSNFEIVSETGSSVITNVVALRVNINGTGWQTLAAAGLSISRTADDELTITGFASPSDAANTQIHYEQQQPGEIYSNANSVDALYFRPKFGAVTSVTGMPGHSVMATKYDEPVIAT